MISNVGALSYPDDKDKKAGNNSGKPAVQSNSSDVVPVVELKDGDKGISIDSFEWQYKKIIIKKGLDKNNDDYIQKDEEKDILDYFEVSDISKLLAKKDAAPDSASEPDAHEPEVDADKFSALIDENNAVLRKDGSAAYELNQTIASDLISSSSAGTPFSAQMKNLLETKKELMKKNADTSDIDAQIDALNEAIKEYIKNNHKDLAKALLDNDAVKVFNYGDGKQGYMIQSFDFKGTNTKNTGNDSDDGKTPNNDATNSDSSSSGDSSDSSGNVAGINVKYGIEVVTENLHAIGNVEAGSDNSNLQAAVVYNNPLKNGGILNFSGNFRQTIEKDNNVTAFGGALDYNKNKFTTGAFCSYKKLGESNQDLTAETYAKYGDSFRLAVGLDNSKDDDITSNYRYVKGKLSGVRELQNSNLTLNGSVEAEYGILDYTVPEENGEKCSYKVPNLNLNAKGGIAFKSKNLSTNVYANVRYNREKNIVTNEYDSTLVGTLVGNISTDKIGITATLTGINSADAVYVNNPNITEDDYIVHDSGRSTKLSSSITITPKKLFGKKLTPSITYNISNDDSIKHYVGVNLGVNL